MSSKTARRTTAARNDRGATAVEYALIIAGIAIAIITSVALVGGQITSGVAAAAEGLSGSPTGSSSTAAAMSTPSTTPTPTATPTPTPTPTVRSCSGSAVDRDGPRDNDYVSPTSCNTSTGTWVCPSGYRLDSVGSNWTCKD